MKKWIFVWSLFVSHLLFGVNSQEEIKVLIVGAGPAGLAAAKALQNRGIYPEIIERQDQIRADGAGIAIPANGSWALSQLGIEISESALLIRDMQFTDDQGDVLIQESIHGIHPAGAQFYSLGRNELVKLLLSHLDPRIQIQTSMTMRSFSEENGRVRVLFSNGESKSYDLLIGCDGVHSSVRGQIHPEETPEFLSLLVWRTVIDAQEGMVMPTYMLGTDRLILLYPMPNQKTYVYGHLFQSEKNPPSQPFSEVFSSFGAPLSKTLQATPFYVHHMEKSHSVRFKLEGFSRVLLIGDAAHAFGPMLQNGAAQAFEDAYVLQDLLTDQMVREEIPAFIDTFEKRREARVKTIFNLSNTKIQAISNPQQLQGRNEAIRKFGAPNVNGFKVIMQQNP